MCAGHFNDITILILLTKTTAARNEAALSYHKVRGLNFLAVIFAATIIVISQFSTCIYGDWSCYAFFY